MLNASIGQIPSGQVVRVFPDGRLAIQVWTLDEGWLLVLTDGLLRAVLPDEIAQRPATCPCCGGAVFWWDDGHFIPWCLSCIPPDLEWRTATLLAASAVAERMGHLIPRWFMSWLAAQERIGPGGWALAQQFTFAPRVASLVVEWHEQKGLL